MLHEAEVAVTYCLFWSLATRATMGIFVDNSECSNISWFWTGFNMGILVSPRPVCMHVQTQIKGRQLLGNRYRRSSFSRNLIQLCVALFLLLSYSYPAWVSIGNHYCLSMGALKILYCSQHQLLDKVLSFLLYSKLRVMIEIEVCVPEWLTLSSVLMRRLASIFSGINWKKVLQSLATFLFMMDLEVGRNSGFTSYIWESIEQLLWQKRKLR